MKLKSRILQMAAVGRIDRRTVDLIQLGRQIATEERSAQRSMDGKKSQQVRRQVAVERARRAHDMRTADPEIKIEIIARRLDGIHPATVSRYLSKPRP